MVLICFVGLSFLTCFYCLRRCYSASYSPFSFTTFLWDLTSSLFCYLFLDEISFNALRKGGEVKDPFPNFTELVCVCVCVSLM